MFTETFVCSESQDRPHFKIFHVDTLVKGRYFGILFGFIHVEAKYLFCLNGFPKQARHVGHLFCLSAWRALCISQMILLVWGPAFSTDGTML